MGLFDRMSRLVSSNVNALLDRAEDPRKALELTLEEMRAQLPVAQREVISSFATEKQLQKKVDALDEDAERWAKRAEIALKADDENLAREALVQKKRVVAERDRTEALLTEARATTSRMKQELERMEAKVKELEARKDSIAAKIAEGRASEGAPAGTAFGEFKRLEQGIEQAESTANAQREVDELLDDRKPAERDLEAEFAALEKGSGAKGGSEIDDELAALKRKMRFGS